MVNSLCYDLHGRSPRALWTMTIRVEAFVFVMSFAFFATVT
jgi:hypothetical protein